MRRMCGAFPVPPIAGLLAGLWLAIVTVSLAVSLNAQPADSSGPHPTLGYDKAHEITINGTVQEVIAKPAAGSPVGLHLVVTGEKGAVDAHLGPYLSKDTIAALRAGIAVQIVGATETLHGKQYLLARQVIFSGRLVTVRSANGLLMQGHRPHARRGGSAKAAAFESNGGAR